MGADKCGGDKRRGEYICKEYPELGMDAVWRSVVEDFPAFILVDDKGNDFFKQILQ